MDAKPVCQPMQDIADYRPGRAGDNPDHRWHLRQGFFARRIEQPLGRQPLATFLELFQHGAFAGDFHLLHDNLVF